MECGNFSGMFGFSNVCEDWCYMLIMLENIQILRCYNINVGFIVFSVPGIGCSAIFRQLVVTLTFFYILGISDYRWDEPWNSLDSRQIC